MPTTTTTSTRSHTFTGCWTCRKRRVKCSGERPFCKRCATAKIQCAGYDFLFDKPEGAQSNRQRLASGPKHVLKLTNAEIEEYLEEIERNDGGSLRKGPFSVVSFGEVQKEEEARWLRLVLDESEERLDEDDERLAVVGSDRRREEIIFAAHNPADYGRVHISIPEYIPIAAMSKLEWELFEHFTNYVAEEVSYTTGSTPSERRHRHIVMSMALSERMSTANLDLEATAAVFHCICASGAMSLSRRSSLPSHQQEYQMRALSHERSALGHLRSCIEKHSTAYLTIAAAIMTLMVFEYMSDRGHMLGGHMQAILRCLILGLPNNASAMVDTTTIAMIEEFLLGNVMFQTAPPAELQTLRRVVGRRGSGYPGAVIPLELIDAIFAIHEAVPNATSLPPSTMENLEKLMASCSLKPSDLPTRAGVTRAVSLHATKIYYNRALLRLPPLQIQALVDMAITHLENLEPSLPVHSLVSWASVMIGSEASHPTLRQRFLAWCDQRLKYNFSNVKGVREIVMLTWHVRAMEGFENVHWYEVVKMGEQLKSGHSHMVKTMLEGGDGGGGRSPTEDVFARNEAVRVGLAAS